MGEKPKVKVSVMYLTARYGGVDLLWASLKRQTFEDWELVFVDALWREREKEVKEYINDPRLKYIRQSDKREGTYTNLAHADNEGFRNCDGELIVCLQDYIWVPAQGLEKFWIAHQEKKGKILISGVGHQYAEPGKDDIIDPKGKITIFKEPFVGKPEHQCWSDPRMRLDQGTFYETAPVNWEMNYSAIPRYTIYQLGGMDENYDSEGFAYDNVNIAVRAEMLGFKTYLDQTNECQALSHDDWAPDQAKVDKKSPVEYHQKVIREMYEGKRSIKLDFLK